MAAVLLPVLLCAGCPSASSKDVLVRLQDEDPAVRATAAVEAADTRNEKALPYLVERLGDVEPDVRMFASLALEKFAGPETSKEMGWRFFDPPAARAKAKEQWRAWLRKRGMAPLPAATQPAHMEETLGPAAATRPASAATGTAATQGKD